MKLLLLFSGVARFWICHLSCHLPLMSAFSNRTQITFSFSSVGGAPVYALSLKHKERRNQSLHNAYIQLPKEDKEHINYIISMKEELKF